VIFIGTVGRTYFAYGRFCFRCRVARWPSVVLERVEYAHDSEVRPGVRHTSSMAAMKSVTSVGLTPGVVLFATERTAKAGWLACVGERSGRPSETDMAQRIRELSATRRIRQILTMFVALQILDVLTTLLGFRFGAVESSPFIGRLMELGPVTGLVVSKVIASALAGAALFTNRERLVRFVNFWFVAVVGWNLIIITLASARA
jgi:uncharacterized protein DUF5658